MKTLEAYKAVFDSSPDGVIITDHLGEIILVNNQVENQFGYQKDELIGKKIEVVIPQRYHSKHSEHRTNYSLSPTHREMGAKKDLWAIKKDGSEFAVEISLSPIKLKNKTLFSAAIRDVSERKKFEAKIAMQNKQLQSQNLELEQFSQIVSHDLQEPLRSLSSFAELLHKKYADKIDDKSKTYIDFIYTSSKRMQSLVKGLLTYSKIGKENELTDVDCNQIVQEVLFDMTISLKESQAKVSIETLPKLNGYPLELRQLFQNLISNALKYVAHGVIPNITISAKKKENEWLFSVHDNGIGISEQNQNKIFTIFKRLHNSNQYEGTGIGLSHCKKIVDLHGGIIWVDSKINEGSTFYFTIPEI